MQPPHAFPTGSEVLTAKFSGQMNCDQCKDQLGVFLDNELAEPEAAAIRAHLSCCDPCAAVCEDLASLLDVCANESAVELVPNSQALWCRINNIIENEVKPQLVPPSPPRRRFWQFSFAQLVTALSCIAVISSLITFLAMRSSAPAEVDELAVRSAPPTTLEKLLSRIGLVETPQQARERRMNERQHAIDYWNARVQQRRAMWDRATREAFDRNLRVIDESVHEYSVMLANDPYDELSGEMLDSVMNEKMNLLRDFSDL